MHGLSRLAALLRRTPAEARLLSTRRDAWSKGAFFLALLALVSGVWVVAFTEVLGRWQGLRPAVTIPAERWRAAYDGDDEGCAPDQARAPCPAAPGVAALFDSPHPQRDQRHRERVLGRRGGTYWVGARVSVDTLQAAAEAGANQLVLGWVNASHRLWIDGELVLEGGFSDTEPIIVGLSHGRLRQPRPLHVAVRIVDDAGASSPDLHYGRGQGFMTRSDATAYRRQMFFWLAGRPMGLFAASLVFALAFFIFWSSARERLEYWYLALYALANAVMHLRKVDLVFLTLSRDAAMTLAASAHLLAGGFAMALGLAFARGRRKLLAWLVVGTAVAPALAVLLAPDREALLAVRVVAADWWVPLGHIAGALFCFVQAFDLSGRRAGTFPVRRRRLVLFGAGLATVGALGLVEELDVIDVMTWHGAGHLALLLGLGALASLELHRERQLIQRTPVSKYHRGPELPEALDGALLVVDLKGSEALFREGARLGQAGALAEECLAVLCAAAIARGGTVLQTEGDAVTAFFAAGDHASPAGAALQAVREMDARLAELSRQLRERRLRGLPEALRFRGGLSVGAIRPVWHQLGDTRAPGWSEVGASNAFVDAARLADLERAVEGEGTRVVLAEALAAALPGEPFARRDLRLTGKHGREYRVAVFEPGAEAARGAA